MILFLKLIAMSLFMTSVVVLGLYCGWIIGTNIARVINGK
jgi:hypothetical protein